MSLALGICVLALSVARISFVSSRLDAVPLAIAWMDEPWFQRLNHVASSLRNPPPATTSQVAIRPYSSPIFIKILVKTLVSLADACNSIVCGAYSAADRLE